MKLANEAAKHRNAVSPPARGRGLKHHGGDLHRILALSPPARGRGLKLGIEGFRPHRIRVAPRTGAWIETYPRQCQATL